MILSVYINNLKTVLKKKRRKKKELTIKNMKNGGRGNDL